MCFALFFFLFLYDSLVPQRTTPKSCHAHAAQSITPIARIIAESSHTTHRRLSDHRFEITLRPLAASPHVRLHIVICIVIGAALYSMNANVSQCIFAVLSRSLSIAHVVFFTHFLFWFLWFLCPVLPQASPLITALSSFQPLPAVSSLCEFLSQSPSHHASSAGGREEWREGEREGGREGGRERW